MPVTTSVTYRVREEVLKDFMTEKFGKQRSSTGDLLWSYVAGDGTTNIGWQLTAYRALTPEERDELRSLSEPAPTPVFGQR
ncbi:hypothetical protein NXS19_014317 [Fusarium pseudograminearum]|nr:hypothetical protein NXS19_014317 [Fusarium pseudograminearum]